MKVFIDIETIPPDKEKFYLSRQSLIPTSHSALVQSSLGIDVQLTEEEFCGLSLQAEYGRILCIGVIIENENKAIRKGVLGFDLETNAFHLDEAKTLRGFWKLLGEFKPNQDLIIGHNVMDFDLPFIYKRSRILKVKPTVKLSFARYRSSPIYDTMKEWSMWNLKEKSISLSSLAELLDVGINKPEGINGSKVYEEFLLGSHQKIADYCLQDVEISKAVFERLIN
jgi:DNA polymerase elongation subunit (family B)